MPELTAQNTGELINIYKEVNTKTDGSYYEAMQRPFELGRVKSQKGIQQIALSSDSKFCATLCATTPKCVWVWDLSDYNLNSILVQEHDVSDLSWCPRSNNLNISTLESSKLYLWSPKGASVCQVPLPQSLQEGSGKDVHVSKVMWNPNGMSFAALDKTNLVFVFPQEQFFDQISV